MAKLILTIELDGDAIQTYHEMELAKIFAFYSGCAANRSDLSDMDGISASDSNGNAVAKMVYEADECEEPFDGFRSDAEADADVLRSCGWGTDEDYNPGDSIDESRWDE